MAEKDSQTHILNLTNEELKVVSFEVKQGYSDAVNTPTEKFLERIKALLKEYK